MSEEESEFLNAIEDIDRDIGIKKKRNKTKTVKELSEEAKGAINGTPLAEDKTAIRAIKFQPKHRQAEIVNLIINKKLTVVQAIKIAEEIEKASNGWPEEFHDVFANTRHELVKSLQVMVAARNRNRGIFVALKNKPKHKTIQRLYLSVDKCLQDAIKLLENYSPIGLCPYCNSIGCPECNSDGWASRHLARKAESEGFPVKRFY